MGDMRGGRQKSIRPLQALLLRLANSPSALMLSACRSEVIIPVKTLKDFTPKEMALLLFALKRNGVHRPSDGEEGRAIFDRLCAEEILERRVTERCDGSMAMMWHANMKKLCWLV